jgi:ABC-2 type transport system ATP-binding protein
VNIIQTDNVIKRYSGHLALDKVSLSVPEQSIYGLLGPNGAGKTTLIRIINMITAPDEGQVLFAGRPMHPPDISRIGYLPEERGLYKKMKVGEQALYLAQLKGLSKHEAMKKLREWFERFEITSWWNKKVEELSKGMQQKVQFIVTVLHEPELLIFDEPFSGFDPINASILKEEILRLKSNGSTIIFSTHNMASVEELCDNIALINRSRKILEGNVMDIRKRHRSNIFEVELSGGENSALALSTGYEIMAEEKYTSHTTFRIKATDHRTPNELLTQLIGQAEVHAFREVLPTMNDIFIDTVKSSQA